MSEPLSKTGRSTMTGRCASQEAFPTTTSLDQLCPLICGIQFISRRFLRFGRARMVRQQEICVCRRASGSRRIHLTKFHRLSSARRDGRNRGSTMQTPKITRRDALRSASAALTLAAVKAAFPGGAFAQACRARDEDGQLGYIALTDASPLVIAKEKGFFAKHGMPDVEVAKQASWGATRDNLVLGSRGERHRRRAYPDADALPDLDRQGDAEQRADADVHPGAPESRRPGDLGRQRIQGPQASSLDASPLKAAFAKKKAEGKELKVAMTFPGGTHDLWIRYWLAAGGIDPDKDVSDHRRAAAADGRQHEGRQHGRLLRRRAVERAAGQPEASASPRSPPARSGTSIRRRRSACAPTGSTSTRRRPRPC